MSEDTIKKTAEIRFFVHTDDKNVPVKIEWEATDAPHLGRKEAKSILLSMWDAQQDNALKIDLWTRDMRVDEMNYFVFQTLMSLSDSYTRATKNEEMAQSLKDFCDYFAEKTGIYENLK